MVQVSESLRRTIRRQGLTNEEFSRKWGLSNGTLYSLLAGRPIKSLLTLRKLSAAGVAIPRDLLNAA